MSIMIKFDYRPLPKGLTIRPSSVDGIGLHATTDWEPALMFGKTHYFHDEGWQRTPLGGFINHSEDPNCVIITMGQERFLVTVRPISVGEELTVYYTLDQK
ncbi:SET domain-containing protein [bacterium]|nr:SET domain-containing protein [bacterium]